MTPAPPGADRDAQPTDGGISWLSTATDIEDALHLVAYRGRRITENEAVTRVEIVRQRSLDGERWFYGVTVWTDAALAPDRARSETVTVSRRDVDNVAGAIYGMGLDASPDTRDAAHRLLAACEAPDRAAGEEDRR